MRNRFPSPPVARWSPVLFTAAGTPQSAFGTEFLPRLVQRDLQLDFLLPAADQQRHLVAGLALSQRTAEIIEVSDPIISQLDDDIAAAQARPIGRPPLRNALQLVTVVVAGH